MIVVVHQHIAMDLYGETLGHFRQQIQKMLETALVSENLPTFDPAVDNMIPTSGQINSSRARHRSIIHFLPRWEQAKCCMLRRDPNILQLKLIEAHGQHVPGSLANYLTGKADCGVERICGGLSDQRERRLNGAADIAGDFI